MTRSISRSDTGPDPEPASASAVAVRTMDGPALAEPGAPSGPGAPGGRAATSAGSAGTSAPRPAGVPQAVKWGLPLAALITGMFMSILDTSIVNVAVPTMQKEFGTTTEDIQWIATAYTLCMGVVVPASAWLSDRVGAKQLYLISLVAFSAASALCGLAWDLNSMIVFRILQAIPGGIIPVVCLTIVYRIVPPAKIGAAMGMYGLGVVVAPAVGPTLGGYLVEYVDWRLIFYINVPIGVLGAVLAFAVLPSFPKTPGRRFDMPGFLCIAASLFALLLALSEGQDWGWTGYRVLMLVVGGVLLLALFVVIELEVREPLLDVRIFTNWAYVNSLLLISVLMVGLFAALFFLPLFLQEGQNMQALDAGLLVMPQALVMLVMMPLAGRLYDKVGPRWPAVIGLLINGIGTLMMCGINADVTRPEIIGWTMFRALGIGLSMMPIMTGGIAALPPSMVGSGSAVNNLAQRVSAAFGLAALTAMSTIQQAQFTQDRSSQLSADDPRIQAMQQQGSGSMGLYPLFQRTQLDALALSYSNVFLVSAALTFGAMLLALFLRSGRAAPAGPEAVEIG